MTLLDDKAALRKTALAARAEAAKRAPAAGDLLPRFFPDEFWPAAGGVVASYRPIGSEISPLALEAVAVARRCRLALPVMRAGEYGLDFRAWSAGEALDIRGFGVPEPSIDAPVLVPELILVPLLGVDLAGGRLGYGKGYYDRTIARLRADGAPRLIGLAFEAQRVERVPVGDHDETLDGLVTETCFVDF
jgi:5-formyltetrahydrofolate cyclo-ligase